MGLGFIFTLFFSLFNGVSLIMIKPLLDYIFTKKPKTILYPDFHSFHQAVSAQLSEFFANFNIFDAFKSGYFDSLESALADIFEKADAFMLLKVICVAIVILLFLKNLFFVLKKISFANAIGKITRDVRKNLVHKYIMQSLSYYKQNRIGDALVRIEKDSRIVSNSLLRKSFAIFQELLNAIILIVFAIYLNAKLLLVSVIIIPPFSIGLSYLGKKNKKYAKRIQRKSSHLFSFIEEKLSSIEVVKFFTNEDYELKRFKEINNKYFKFWRKSEIYKALSRPISELNGMLIGLIIVLVGGYQVLVHPDVLSFGDYMAFLMVTFAILTPLKKIAKHYPEVKKGLVSLDRIFYVINQKITLKEKKDAVSKSTFDKEIKLRNVSFSYDAKKKILKNINLTIKKGEQVAFVGGSGSGKTTLARLIPRIYEVDEGDITIDGVSLKKIKLKDLRNLFGVVPQDPKLFSDTLAYNIGYANPEEMDLKKITAASEIAHAHEFINQLDEEYDYRIENKGGNFSGGQKQRISIARAVAGDPAILIFDEATSALDTESERKVQEAIENATKNHTVIVIAHRLSTVIKSDKIVVLDEGEIIDEGSHEELLKRCAKYQNFYRLQSN